MHLVGPWEQQGGHLGVRNSVTSSPSIWEVESFLALPGRIYILLVLVSRLLCVSIFESVSGSLGLPKAFDVS